MCPFEHFGIRKNGKYAREEHFDHKILFRKVYVETSIMVNCPLHLKPSNLYYSVQTLL